MMSISIQNQKSDKKLTVQHLSYINYLSFFYLDSLVKPFPEYILQLSVYSTIAYIGF